MSADKDADLAPRSWKNYHRSRRASEMRRDLSAVDENPVVTDWWKQAGTEGESSSACD